jgi:hypothetical protein
VSPYFWATNPAPAVVDHVKSVPNSCPMLMSFGFEIGLPGTVAGSGSTHEDATPEFAPATDRYNPIAGQHSAGRLGLLWPASPRLCVPAGAVLLVRARTISANRGGKRSPPRSGTHARAKIASLRSSMTRGYCETRQRARGVHACALSRLPIASVGPYRIS